MKDIVLIHNPVSGSVSRRRRILDLRKCKKILRKNNYNCKYLKTKYKGHATELIQDLEDSCLVITIGGDGTFNEAVAGNLKREKPLVLSHIPQGTTNDLGAIFCLGKNMPQNLELILQGEVRDIDICDINGEPFVYVAGFGKFMNIPYETTRDVKKRWGYIAYVTNGIKDFFTGKTHLYEIVYEFEGKKYQSNCSFALISNANRIAGIKNIYDDVKINDRKFEVLLCRLRKKSEIVKALFAMASSNIRNADGFEFFRTDNLKITFRSYLRKPWCIDGEQYTNQELEYEIKIDRSLKMLLPQKALKEGGAIVN